MRIELSLAGILISIAFEGQTKAVAPMYDYFFNGFITREKRTDASLNVNFLPDSINAWPFTMRDQNLTSHSPVFSSVHNHGVVQWLEEIGKTAKCLSFSKSTLCCLFLNGLLLYSPETSSGKIYILRDGLGNFRSLYFLFWLYLAEVLGERGCCFLHAAALVKDEKGYLFPGDSGAGKSTISRLCSNYQIFSDDGPIIRSQNGVCRVYPSPFHQQDSLRGIENEVNALGVPIVRFYFLVKDEKIFIAKISKKMAFSMLLTRHIHFFQGLSTSTRLKLFDLFSGVCNTVPLHYFHFSKNKNICSYLTRMNGG